MMLDQTFFNSVCEPTCRHLTAGLGTDELLEKCSNCRALALFNSFGFKLFPDNLPKKEGALCLLRDFRNRKVEYDIGRFTHDRSGRPCFKDPVLGTRVALKFPNAWVELKE